MNKATPEITARKAGRFFFVQVDGVTIGHTYKLLAFQGEPAWKALARMIFRPLWRASANSMNPDAGTVDGFVHLEELYGSVFRNRDEAIRAILEYHGIDGRPRYLRPWSRRELRAVLEDEPPAQGTSL